MEVRIVGFLWIQLFGLVKRHPQAELFFFFFFFSEGWGCSIHKVELKLLTSRDILADNPYTSHHFWASHCDLRFVLVLAE
jgi:hypothetical protein